MKLHQRQAKAEKALVRLEAEKARLIPLALKEIEKSPEIIRNSHAKKPGKTRAAASAYTGVHCINEQVSQNVPMKTIRAIALRDRAQVVAASHCTDTVYIIGNSRVPVPASDPRVVAGTPVKPISRPESERPLQYVKANGAPVLGRPYDPMAIHRKSGGRYGV